MKKMILAILITTSAAMSGTSLAQTPAPAPAPTSNSFAQLSGDISSGISSGMRPLEQLKKFIEDKYYSTMKLVHSQNYQDIPNLKQIQATNTAQATVTVTKKADTSKNAGTYVGQSTSEKVETVQKKLSPLAAATHVAGNATSDNVANSLTQFRYAILKDAAELSDTTGNDAKEALKELKTADGKQPFKDYMNSNNETALSIGDQFRADDTLYIHNIRLKGDETMRKFKAIEKPAEKNNDPFSFESVITPITYSPEQLDAAKQFVKFAAQSTQDLTAGAGLGSINNNPEKLLTLVKSPKYQKYKLTMRTIIAIRSMLINTLNQLIAERTPLPGLGIAAGLKPRAPQAGGENSAQQPPRASPLQVEAYQANHRIEDPNWYKTIQNASPATVQRETLIVLAEMEHQNYEAHLDNERLLSAIAAQGLQSNLQAISIILKEEAPKVNGVINPAPTK